MWLISSRHDRNTQVPGLKWLRYAVLENEGKILAEVWLHRVLWYVTFKCYSKCDLTRLELLKQLMILSFLSFFFYNLASCIRPRGNREARLFPITSPGVRSSWLRKSEVEEVNLMELKVNWKYLLKDWLKPGDKEKNSLPQSIWDKTVTVPFVGKSDTGADWGNKREVIAVHILNVSYLVSIRGKISAGS